jgi:catechol 2,3-dioxygenase
MNRSNGQFALLGARLRVASLRRARDFYAGVLGLQAQSAGPGSLSLRASPGEPELLSLVEAPGVPPAPEDAAGLFHLALLVPDRISLARVLRRIAEGNGRLQGLSDHGVSEAIYLADPDGNGLEIYADWSRDQWPRDGGRLAMFTRPLDVDNLLATSPGEESAGLPAGTRLGHVHLRVTDLAAAEGFYTGQLGLDVTVRDYPGALFFAANGYHHHVGTNTWQVRAPRPAAPHAGLIAVRAAIPGLPAARTADDPDGNRFELTPG